MDSNIIHINFNLPEYDHLLEYRSLYDYVNYLQEHAKREKNSLYESDIGFSNKMKKYTFRGKEIKKIVFLFDNVEYGTATCNTLRAYLDMPLSDDTEISPAVKRAYKRRHRYYCNRKEVPVSEILRRNQGVEVQER